MCALPLTKAQGALLNLATPPKFEDAHEARRMLRERLAASCRIMAWQKLDGGIVRRRDGQGCIY